MEVYRPSTWESNDPRHGSLTAQHTRLAKSHKTYTPRTMDEVHQTSQRGFKQTQKQPGPEWLNVALAEA
jgi:hypothetical protein